MRAGSPTNSILTGKPCETTEQISFDRSKFVDLRSMIAAPEQIMGDYKIRGSQSALFTIRAFQTYIAIPN